MLDAAAGFGAEAVFQGAANPDTPAADQQAAFIDQAIAQGVDGIGLTVTDAAVLSAPIRRAVDAGIPVVAFNIPISDEDFALHDLPVTTYVGQIEPVMAQQAALRAVNLIEQGGGTVDVAVCIKGSVNLPWAVQRCQGMSEALTPLGIQVEILAGEFFAQPPEVPEDEIEAWFVANPGVDFVFTTATPVLGLALRLRREGVIGEDVMIASVDLNAETLDAIQMGECEFAVDQQPYLQGHETIAVLHLQRLFALRPGAPIQTGPFFVDASNVDDIAELVRAGYR